MSDQRMPQISGVELLEKVKSKNPRAIRLLFTGFADVESIVAAINQGHVFQFLKKPWQPEELEAAVRQAAIEYDRLTEADEERRRLLRLIDNLQSRVDALEAEFLGVKALAGARAGSPAGPPTH
ncbi:MAG: response regulator, partial [Thermoleophilia bacterium]|nr:response regulator [Thermoleophilia bacterium]